MQKISKNTLPELWTNFYRLERFTSNYKLHSGHTDQLMDEKDQQEIITVNNEGILRATSSLRPQQNLLKYHKSSLLFFYCLLKEISYNTLTMRILTTVIGPHLSLKRMLPRLLNNCKHCKLLKYTESKWLQKEKYMNFWRQVRRCYPEVFCKKTSQNSQENTSA